MVKFDACVREKAVVVTNSRDSTMSCENLGNVNERCSPRGASARPRFGATCEQPDFITCRYAPTSSSPERPPQAHNQIPDSSTALLRGERPSHTFRLLFKTSLHAKRTHALRVTLIPNAHANLPARSLCPRKSCAASRRLTKGSIRPVVHLVPSPRRHALRVQNRRISCLR